MRKIVHREAWWGWCHAVGMLFFFFFISRDQEPDQGRGQEPWSQHSANLEDLFRSRAEVLLFRIHLSVQKQEPACVRAA